MNDATTCKECGVSILSDAAHVRLTGSMRKRLSQTAPVIVNHLVILCDECLNLKKYSDRELAREDWNEIYTVGSK
jgi:RNase P subunit RPR2